MTVYLASVSVTLCIHVCVLCSVTSVLAQPRQVSSALRVEQTTSDVSADQLLRFADSLFHTGEYFRAITEYRRFLFHHSDDGRCAMAHFSIGLAWYRGGSFAEALATFQEVAARYPNTPYGEQAWLWQGESLARQGHYVVAGQFYHELMERFRGAMLEEQARYQYAWTLLYQRHWHEAATQFRRIPPDSTLYHNAQVLADGSLEGEYLPAKSPLLAGVLSAVLPGSGQLYTTRLGDALLAFCLNGLFIAGAIEAVHHKVPIVAGILSVFEAGWYVGNIYGAVNSAHKHNRHVEEVLLHNLDNSLRLPLPTPPSRQTGIIGIQFSLDF